MNKINLLENLYNGAVSYAKEQLDKAIKKKKLERSLYKISHPKENDLCEKLGHVYIPNGKSRISDKYPATITPKKCYFCNKKIEELHEW